MSRVFSSTSKGFTLLEILVSSAILAFSLVALVSLQGNTLLTSRRAETLTIATQLAEEKMGEIEIELHKDEKKGEFPDEKSESGTFEGIYSDYKWSYEIKRIDLPAPPLGNEGSIQALVGKQLTEEIKKTVRELKLIVSWQENNEEQTVDIVTHIVKL
ncbi:MAG: hypothetical protein COV43_00260 [Deltaproteobacteria bacterium CG11_big_fil_rev_8_21_14_0_20_42_23]|nr:MAG: hypothetical protein COV43_00260 [Deltaproteobacteria bacterium CG11_big_fil_rev_8_21_14_0_20_42_23]PJC64451.1 MAG: hypothetical protein CO021_04165 [Deltaproteobacteria bacterium CG_4_9_14_0_2_um_filter_42_21]